MGQIRTMPLAGSGIAGVAWVGARWFDESQSAQGKMKKPFRRVEDYVAVAGLIGGAIGVIQGRSGSNLAEISEGVMQASVPMVLRGLYDLVRQHETPAGTGGVGGDGARITRRYVSNEGANRRAGVPMDERRTGAQQELLNTYRKIPASY